MATGPLEIRGGTLIDGTGERPLKDATVRVVGGSIAAVWAGTARPAEAGTEPDSVFDATGMTEAEVNQRAEAWIEDEMHRISPHRYSDASHNAT